MIKDLYFYFKSTFIFSIVNEVPLDLIIKMYKQDNNFLVLLWKINRKNINIKPQFKVNNQQLERIYIYISCIKNYSLKIKKKYSKPEIWFKHIFPSQNFTVVLGD